MPGLTPSNLHLDILMGRDEAIEVVDIFGGAYLRLQYLLRTSTPFTIGMEAGPPLDFHKEMEQRRM